MHEGKIYSGTSLEETADTMGYDLWVYDCPNSTWEWLDQSPWDQLSPDVDGHVVAYLDTEELGSRWFFNGNQAHVEIMDMDTLLTRQITLEPQLYYGIGIAGRYLSFGVLTGGDVIVLCDLEEGGFMDVDGHVCPEEGCSEPDGGADGGTDAGPDGG